MNTNQNPNTPVECGAKQTCNGVELAERFVDLYSNAQTNTGRPIALTDIFDGIRFGNWRKVVEEYREAKSAGKAERAKLIKQSAPAITPCGTFSPTRNRENIATATGCIVVDVDHLASLEKAEEVRNRIGADPHCLGAFVSIGGLGVKGIFFVGSCADDAEAKAAFGALAQYLREQHSIEVDASGKDICRLSFVSFDENIVVRNGPIVPFLLRRDAPQPKSSSTPAPCPAPSQDSNEAVVKDALRVMNAGCSYGEWLRVACAVKNGLGDSGFSVFDTWSATVPDKYTRLATRKLWDSIKPNGGITVATLYKMAADRGWNNPYGRSEQAEKIALHESIIHPMQKRNDAVDAVAAQEVPTCAGLQFVEAADLIDTDPPPLDPIIIDAFEMGDKVELVGGSKQRKSFFMIDLLFHLAAGRDWLEFKIPKRWRVIYVNLELKDAWIHRRIHNNARAYGMTADDVRGYFLIVNARGKGAIVRNTLPEFVRESGAAVVAIDPRYKLMLPGESENAGEGVAGILSMMDDIAEDGPAVLMAHHDSKGDQSEKSATDRGGGSGWSGRDVDCKFILSPQRDEPDTASVVESVRRNYAPVEPVAVRWVDHRFRLAPDLAPVKFGYEQRKRQNQINNKPKIEDCEFHVLAVATEVMSRGELASRTSSRLPSASRQTIRDSIDSLIRCKKLAQTPRAGNKGGSVKYGTPEAINEYINQKLPS